MKPESLVGQKFSRLKVLKSVGKKTNRTYLCLCDCGKERKACRSWLLHGYVKSCGCLQKTAYIVASTKHGMSKSPEYRTYRGMFNRCYNKNFPAYINYGARGIRVCKRWHKSFTNFYADMGLKPSPKHSLDRINNNGNYEPSNCRWATIKEQCNNRRRNIKVSYLGETKTLSEWSKSFNIDRHSLKHRLFDLNWPIKKALTTPMRKRFYKIPYNGKTMSIIEWSRETGIHKGTLRGRIIERNWPIKMALSCPVTKKNRYVMRSIDKFQ